MSAVNDIECLVLCIVLFIVNCVNVSGLSLTMTAVQIKYSYYCLQVHIDTKSAFLVSTVAAVGTSGWMQKFASFQVKAVCSDIN